MKPVLAVPNWSIAEPPSPPVVAAGARLHYAAGDSDHGRTVTAWSGSTLAVQKSILETARAWLPTIDLQHQCGVHPRIGALDVCPFVGDVNVEAFAAEFSQEFGIPVTLYEQSAGGRPLPDVRRGLFPPQFGAAVPHPQWGTTVMGRRGPLVALNANFPAADATRAKRIAREIRDRRDAGDPAWRGVRALGFYLVSRGLAQVSLNLTRPLETPPDDVLAAIAAMVGTEIEPELIGVIDERVVPRATRLHIDPAQITPALD